MEKLTKEQAQGLIERIKAKIETRDNKDYPLNDGELTLAPHMVEQIINQCTEKGFPNFVLPCQIEHISNGQLEVRHSPIAKCIHMYFKGSKMVSWNYEEFKQLTDNCVAIYNWLDEQNA